MTSVEVIIDSTEETGELFLLLDGEPYNVPETQDKANKGKILVYPDFEDQEDINITPAFPKVVDNEDVFIYWYTFYYLMRGTTAPPQIELHYLKISS